jgi:hypothetical protein
MSDIRRVIRILKSQPTIEGAGVHLKRVFSYQRAPELDPFLLMDNFGSDNPSDYVKGFPWHPHRGIETITYMLDGEVDHGDSMGNSGVISAGGIQWMTAGSGIVHQEMPRGTASGSMHGFQVWANLPAKNKMMDPRYQDITADQVPTIKLGNGVTVKVLCGTVNGVKGPVNDIISDPQYLDVRILADGTYTHAVYAGYTAFAFVFEGDGYFEPASNDKPPTLAGKDHLVIFGDGDQIEIKAGTSGVRFLLLSGKPIREPVAWYGPIVMNTQQELITAFEEYQNGTFLKHQKGER